MQSGMARRLSVLYSVFRVYRFALVGLGGLEPPTSRLSGVRSNQLSYRPMSWDLISITYRRKLSSEKLVGLGGLEPPTSRLSGVRSNQLSYRPIS